MSERRRDYLVECYAAGDADVREFADRARCLPLADGSVDAAYRQSIRVPEDETCFHVFSATSAAAVEDAVRRIGLRHVRIVEAVRAETPRLCDGATPTKTPTDGGA